MNMPSTGSKSRTQCLNYVFFSNRQLKTQTYLMFKHANRKSQGVPLGKSSPCIYFSLFKEVYWLVHPQVSNKGRLCGYELVEELQGYRSSSHDIRSLFLMYEKCKTTTKLKLNWCKDKMKRQIVASPLIFSFKKGWNQRTSVILGCCLMTKWQKWLIIKIVAN